MSSLLLFTFGVFPYWRGTLKNSQRNPRRDTYMYLYRYPKAVHALQTPLIFGWAVVESFVWLHRGPASTFCSAFFPFVGFPGSLPTGCSQVDSLCPPQQVQVQVCSFRHVLLDTQRWWKAVGCKIVSVISTTMPPAFTENYRWLRGGGATGIVLNVSKTSCWMCPVLTIQLWSPRCRRLSSVGIDNELSPAFLLLTAS